MAGLLKIRGSELQQRYTELIMLAAGPSGPTRHPRGHGGRLAGRPMAGWCLDRWRRLRRPALGSYLNTRKTTIYGGSNEVQRNILAQTLLG